MTKRFGSAFLSLDKKLLAIVLLVNMLFTLTWILASTMSQQQDELKNQAEDLKYIEAVIIPSIANSVWNVDLKQTRVQLQGILVNPRIVRVEIHDTDINDKAFLDIGKSGTYKDIQRVTFNLMSPLSEGGHQFGTMTMYTTLDPVMARLKSELYRYFASEVLETLILSLLILYSFRILVVKHLRQISKFFEENRYISKTTPHFSYRPRAHFRDEIDGLVDSINLTIDKSKSYQALIEDLKDHAEKANQAKSMFLASINHELRTPLNAILGVAELLPESKGDKQEMQQLLDIQKRSGLHLLHLIDEILDFSKIEAGQVKIEDQPMDIRGSLETCRKIMEAPIKERGNCIEFVVDPTFPSLIRGDSNRINQIIINLVSNANKFTNQGRITVEIHAQEDQFEILVKDTGIGIPAEKLEEIFIPFRQLENQPSQMRKGTGIGLSITQKLVGFMNGKIQVESQLGVGSTFRITLPLRISQPEVPSEPKALTAANEPHRRIKLLVVEDTPEVQMLIQAYLKGTDVDLSFADNGREGVQKFESSDPSLILMDLQMPVMNGFEATRKIREIEEHYGNHHVRILALTALTTKSDLDSALLSGCDGYVTKPFSRSKLLKTLEDAASDAAS